MITVGRANQTLRFRALRASLVVGVLAGVPLSRAHGAEAQWISLCGTNGGAVQTCAAGSGPLIRSVGADVRLGSGSATANPRFGSSVAMGYLNNDDFIDLVVGAPGESRVYIYLGELVTPGLSQNPAGPTADSHSAPDRVAGATSAPNGDS